LLLTADEQSQYRQEVEEGGSDDSYR
jgi:hypothetical protein